MTGGILLDLLPI